MKPRKIYYIKLWTGDSSMTTAATSYKKAIEIINENKIYHDKWIISNSEIDAVRIINLKDGIWRMKITLTKSSKGWIADFPELPGSPPVGDGETKHEAIACLFFRNIENLPKLRSINETLEINGQLWQPGI